MRADETDLGDWRRNLVSDDAELAAIFRASRTIAVVGAKPGAAEPAHYVPAYLAAQGYAVVAVNPRFAGRELLGAPTVARLGDLRAPVDVVEIFRRPEHLPAHAEEILALGWRPKVVWFQLGIRNDTAAEQLARGGIRVVQDRCMMPEHQRLLGTGAGRAG